MSTIFIAFIECVLKDPILKWQTVWGFPNRTKADLMGTSIYNALKENAEVDLVDIAGTRRYIAFIQNAEIRIINNVLIYNSDHARDITVDENKQFQKKKRIDE